MTHDVFTDWFRVRLDLKGMPPKRAVNTHVHTLIGAYETKADKESSINLVIIPERKGKSNILTGIVLTARQRHAKPLWRAKNFKNDLESDTIRLIGSHSQAKRG